MKIKSFISQVGEPETGTNKNGQPWTKRIVTLTRPVTLESGKQVSEQFLTEYFGDTPSSELRKLAADREQVEATIWFGIHDYTDSTGKRRQFQSITLKSLARTM